MLTEHTYHSAVFEFFLNITTICFCIVEIKIIIIIIINNVGVYCGLCNKNACSISNEDDSKG